MSDAGSGRSAAWERVSQRPHVVVISDDPDLREFFVQGLLLAGFWTSAIASGIQVIEVFRMRRFDLILLDAEIRGLPAAEIIRRLRGRGERGQEPLTQVPVVVVSSGDHSEDLLSGRERFNGLGVNGFLRPPMELDDIAIRLMTIVADWRAEHPAEPWADASVPQSRGSRDPATG